MKYTIKKGSHYVSGLHLPGFSWVSPASRTYTVNFSQSAWYEPSLDPERDWNKLCGWSIGILPKKLPNKPWYKLSSWVPAHHWNSVRVGWRSAGTKDDPRIELALYTYHQGVREVSIFQKWGEPFQFHPQETIEVTLMLGEVSWAYSTFPEAEGDMKNWVEGKSDFIHSLFPENYCSYPLNPFFGGQGVAPHTITLEVTQQ